MIEKNKIIKYSILCFLFLLAIFVLNIMADVKEKNLQFKGVIQSIVYNEKKTPLITVNGQKYALSTNWRFNEKMAVGDSLIKLKDSMNYTLIKHQTGEIILSK